MDKIRGRACEGAAFTLFWAYSSALSRRNFTTFDSSSPDMGHDDRLLLNGSKPWNDAAQ